MEDMVSEMRLRLGEWLPLVPHSGDMAAVATMAAAEVPSLFVFKL